MLATLRALSVGPAARGGGDGSGTILAGGGAGLFGRASDDGGHDPDHAVEAATVRVPIEKVDSLVNLVGELVITQSMIARLVAHLGPDRARELEEAVARMDRHARELQERVMAVRMLPIRTVFGRFPRLVRDLAHAQGKQVVLEASGEDTELDKSLIEQITDPLTHLLRNAIDHGIEPPEARRAAGKPGVGYLRLRAYQEGGNIHLEVADDGRGLDRDRIARKAEELGLLTADARPSDDEIFGLIWEPGFTTADTVSQVSGRGVGLDVVRRNVETLGGSITVHTERGRGTTFDVRLPLTLVILDGQSLRVGSHTYILPLAAIVESLRPRPGQVSRVFTDAEVVVVRGEAVPMIRLHRVFDIAPATEDPSQGIMVIVEHGGRDVALFVDELGGQQQVVIKSLEANFQKVTGVAGATILSDGGVALILDVPRLGGGPRDRQGRRGAECQGAAARNGQLEVEARPAQRSARAGVPVEPGGPISTLQDGGQWGPDHRGVRERRAGRKGRVRGEDDLVHPQGDAQVRRPVHEPQRVAGPSGVRRVGADLSDPDLGPGAGGRSTGRCAGGRDQPVAAREAGEEVTQRHGWRGR